MGRGSPEVSMVFFFATVLSNPFPSAGLSAAHFRTDWLLDLNLAAKWSRLLFTQLTTAYPIRRGSKCNEGWAS